MPNTAPASPNCPVQWPVSKSPYPSSMLQPLIQTFLSLRPNSVLTAPAALAARRRPRSPLRPRPSPGLGDSDAGIAKRCDGCGEAGAEHPSLPQVGVADNGLARRRRITSGLSQITRRASSERGVCKKAQFRAVDPVTLQFRHGALELFRIVENGYGFANCRLLHTALLLGQLDVARPQQ